jgi:uncharacterized protein (TIGR01777 family)
MASILLAGGTGLIGQRLCTLLQQEGHQVSLLSRRKTSKGPYPSFFWNPEAGDIDHDAMRQADVVINLAGAGIADARWSPARKREIIESRTKSTLLLLESMQCTGHTPQAFLSGAAIGYYGERGNELLSENAPPGRGFLAESCVAWEEAIAAVASAGIRTVAFRIGIVLSTKGGALEKMILPARMGAGAYFGDGAQWYSWIHIDDVCHLFMHAIQQATLAGTYNAVAPNPATNKELAAALMRALDRPQILLPAPAFALKLAMGEMADVVLNSTRVSSAKVEASGFRFSHPNLEAALLDLLTRKI